MENDRQGLRSHLSGSVPISVAAHVVVLVVLLLIPLSEVVQPVPAGRLPDYIPAAPTPPPPPIVRPATPSRPSASAPSDGPPVTAPRTITPEEPRRGVIDDDAIPS